MTHDQTWNLSLLYAEDTDPQIDLDLAVLEKANQAFAVRWRKRTDYLTQPEVLLQALEEREQLSAHYGTSGKPGYYFDLRSSQDINNPNIRARLNKIEEVGKRNSNAIRFFGLNLGKIPNAQQKAFLEDSLLQKYHVDLAQLFERAKYSLTDPEERIFSLLSEPAYGRWTEMLSGFLAKEERVVLLENGVSATQTFNDLSSLIASQKKEVRDTAAVALNDILANNVDVAENELNAILETKKVSDELRGFERADQSRLVSDNIEAEVVDALVEAVAGQFDIAHRFYALKAKLLGLPRLAYHERGVEYGNLGGEFSYEKSLEVLGKTLSKLDPQFASVLQSFVTNGQIDVYPRLGKRGGAFCAFDRVDLPVYILLNHTNKLRDVTTLAHEVGHGINDELVRLNQPPVYVGTPLSTAEVASTFMEDFVLDELSDASNDDLHLAILMMKLNDDVSTVFRQIAAYRFEQELHPAYVSAGYLSKKEIGEMFQKHMSAYMGAAVEQSPGSENWWVGWHHFRRPFYVYSYASGLLISKSLQRAVKVDPRFITQVKTFLSAGLSDSPKNIFAKLQIDITDSKFWLTGLTEIDQHLAQAEMLAVRLGKI